MKPQVLSVSSFCFICALYVIRLLLDAHIHRTLLPLPPGLGLRACMTVLSLCDFTTGLGRWLRDKGTYSASMRACAQVPGAHIQSWVWLWFLEPQQLGRAEMGVVPQLCSLD